MPRTRPPYPLEFRLEAVRMLRAGVRTPKQLAEELGCSEQTLRNWWRQDEADRGERDDWLSEGAMSRPSVSSSAPWMTRARPPITTKKVLGLSSSRRIA